MQEEWLHGQRPVAGVGHLKGVRLGGGEEGGRGEGGRGVDMSSKAPIL